MAQIKHDRNILKVNWAYIYDIPDFITQETTF
jgi:hypothetical protein